MNTAPTLRPLSLVEMLDGAFRLFRANFVLFTGIVAFLLVPITLLQLLSWLLFSDLQVIALLQSVFFQAFITAALAQAISAIYLNQEITITGAYGSSKHRFLSIFGALFLQGLAVGIPIFALVFCAATAGGEAVAGILILFLVVPYVLYVTTRWAVVVPGVVLEDLGAADGLRRSWHLTDGSVWRVLGILVISGILTLVVAELPGLTLTLLLEMLAPTSTFTPLVSMLVTQITLLIALPFTTAVNVLLYYDLRVRREGYDLELLAQDAASAL